MTHNAAGPTWTTLEVDDRDDRVVARLDRPQERNAISKEMVDELHEVCAQLETDPRVLIVTGGEQGTFAAGADIGELRDRGRDDALAGVNLRLFERIRALPLPTIAAIDGYALGGGAELAYSCDLRLITERTVFGQPEPRLGIMAGAGAAWRLPRLVGESVAKQVLLAGAQLDAEQSRRHGLVLDVVPPAELLEQAHQIADRIVRDSALALRLSKMAVDAPEQAHPQLDLVAQAVLFEAEDKRQRTTAFLDERGQGRQPRESDR
ncbi:MAG TPA: enoyl-CoA hydratase/isomerase family protein [Jiangellaceae bacterium]|nr:enoyl-CoA hydratase/isomerase family protein [Jiangellaceae bacterium]